MASKTKTNLIHLEQERLARRGDTKMSGREVLAEFEALLDAGTHPLLAADMLGMRYDSLYKLASRNGRKDLFARTDLGAWERYHFNRVYAPGRPAAA